MKQNNSDRLAQTSPIEEKPAMDTPAILHVDDSAPVLRAISRLFGHSAVDYHSTTNPLEVSGLAKSLGDRLKVVILDGTIEPRNHGVDVLDRLDEAGYLARRDEVLQTGQLERGKLLAVLCSGGLPQGAIRKRFIQACQDGRFSASFEKPFRSPQNFRDFITMLATNPSDAFAWLKTQSGLAIDQW